jgi:hypothetical protein
MVHLPEAARLHKNIFASVAGKGHSRKDWQIPVSTKMWPSLPVDTRDRLTGSRAGFA